MPDPIRIRAQLAGDRAVIRLLMTHPMENGQRRDESGRTLPAWFIQTATITHNGRAVLTGQWGTSVAKDPYLQFALRGVKAGDRIGASWVDNRGERRSDEIVVAG